MSVSRLMTQASVVLRDCLGVQPGGEVLIAWDETVDREIVDAHRYAATALGVRPYVLVHEPVVYRPMQEYGVFAGTSLVPGGITLPKGLEGVLRSCDAILLCHSDMELILYAPALKEIIRGGARVLSLLYLSTEAALRVLPASFEEVEEVRIVTEAGGRRIGEAKHARVTSPAGTDITMSLGQYAARVHSGVNTPGSLQILPGGQVTRIPDDGTANGTIVIDRTIAATDYKQLSEPVRFTVENGYVTKIEGGTDADVLRRFLASKNHREAYHVTELAYGTNRRCRLSGIGGPAEDTHTWGCVSFAIGADVHIGGETVGPAHVDMTMRFATMELDGEPVVKDGDVVLTS